MHSVFYLIGVVVVVLALLSFLGLAESNPVPFEAPVY